VPYRALADAVLVVHLGFIVFVVLGGFAVARWPRLAWLHLPAAAWGLVIEWAGWTCPLTPLESALRRRGDQAGYAGGFVEHWIAAVVYPPGLDRRTQMALGALVLVINLIAYGYVARRARRVRGD
jgi:hypothetical protein